VATYSGESYECLFYTPSGEIGENAFESLRHKNVFRYRAKTIKSGDVVEVEIYPIWNTKVEAKAARAAESRAAQRALNRRNSAKTLARLVDNNFTKDDVCVYLTYADKGEWHDKKPILPDKKQARKHIRKFMRDVRAYRKRNGMSELKYVYVMEFFDGEGRKARAHHHIIMSGIDREVIKKLWKYGGIGERRLDPENYGNTLAGLVHYITKQPVDKQTKKWAASRNLKPPKVTIADTKLSKKQAERLAADVKAAAPTIFNKHFPDCELDECYVRSSEIVAGAYIYARMHKDYTVKWKG